jgi:hypothetical protein
MRAPTARQLSLLGEEVRALAAQMRDPDAKQIMTRLALTYDRLATFAVLREATEQNAGSDQSRTERA